MATITIDHIGTTFDCTDEQAAQIATLGAALDDARNALGVEADPIGPVHAAYRDANRAHTAALAAAGDPMANLL